MGFILLPACQPLKSNHCNQHKLFKTNITGAKFMLNWKQKKKKNKNWSNKKMSKKNKQKLLVFSKHYRNWYLICIFDYLENKFRKQNSIYEVKFNLQCERWTLKGGSSINKTHAYLTKNLQKQQISIWKALLIRGEGRYTHHLIYNINSNFLFNPVSKVRTF